MTDGLDQRSGIDFSLPDGRTGILLCLILISSTYLTRTDATFCEALLAARPSDETVDPWISAPRPCSPLHTNALDTNLQLPCAGGFDYWRQLAATS